MPAPLKRVVAAAALASVMAYTGAAFADVVFVSEPPTRAVVGSPYSYEIVAEATGGGDDGGGGPGGGGPGGDKTKIALAAPVLPPWLELRGSRLDGTPELPNAGANPVVLTATAKDQLPATQAFTIVVDLPLNAAPTLVGEISPDPQTATEGMDYAFSVAAFFTDPDGGSLTFSQSGLPGGLSMNSGGTISGRPQPGTAGAHAVTVTASDGTESASDSFALNVLAANRPPEPAGSIGAQSTTEGAPFTLDVSKSFKDPDGDALAFSASGLPAGLAIDAGGKIGGSVQAGSAAASPYTVTVTASDPGGLTASSAFTLTVAAANRPPQLSTPIEAQSATEGADFSGDVSDNFTDPDGDTLSFRAAGLPSGLTLAGSGKIGGRPAAGSAAGSPYTVTVTASDPAGLEASGSFTVTVTPAPNRPPELSRPIAPNPQSAAEDADYRFNVSGFFKDPDGDTLQYSASGVPAGVAIDAASGVISGRPAAGAAAGSPYSVTVTASDGEASATGGFTLEVKPPNQPPSLPDPAPRLSTAEDTPLTLTATMLNAVDENPASLEVILTAPAGGAHFTVKGATVHPAADFNGTIQVEARVKDEADATSNTVTVTIDVTAVNDAPAIKSIPDQSASEGSPFTLEVGNLVSDAEKDPLTYSASNLPTGLSIDAATGAITGTPPVGSAGDYRVGLTVSDGAASGERQFLLKVAMAGRTDLEATAAVAPNPVLISQTATWTVGVNNTGSLDVPNVDLEAVFSGDVPLRFDPVDPACTLEPQGSETRVRCRFTPVAAGTSATINVTASSTQAGHAAAVVTVAIADAVPIDGNEANDTARASLDITQTLNTSAAQRLDAPGATAAAAGDFNGDGYEDLAAATAAGPVVFINGPSADDPHKLAFTALPLSFADPAGATGVAAADLDGDGDVDLAVASASAPDGLLVNDGSAAFQPAPLADQPAGSRAVAAADVNGDGHVDLIFANDGANELYLNDGVGGFTRGELAGAPAHSLDVAAVNLAGDSLPELVFANADGGATIYVSSGGAFAPVSIDTGPTTSVATADFDGDGAADLVFGEAAGANRVYLNTSGSTLTFFPAAELDGVATIDVLAGDFDLDGLSDVLTIDAVGAHALYTNAGGASTQFLLHPEQFSSPSAAGAVAGKFNGDDRADVAVAGGDALGIFLNDGRGNLGLGDVEAPVLTLNGEPTVTVAVGDMYVDAGATASDAIDGDLTDAITVTNPVDASLIGTYTVSYDVVDSAGNAATTVQRSVNVQARDAGGGGGGGGIGLELGLLALAPLVSRLRRSLKLTGAQKR